MEDLFSVDTQNQQEQEQRSGTDLISLGGASGHVIEAQDRNRIGPVTVGFTDVRDVVSGTRVAMPSCSVFEHHGDSRVEVVSNKEHHLVVERGDVSKVGRAQSRVVATIDRFGFFGKSEDQHSGSADTKVGQSKESAGMTTARAAAWSRFGCPQ